jgi:hypothetical protein
MKTYQSLILLLVVPCLINAQDHLKDLGYFVKYNYSSSGTALYQASNPFDYTYFIEEYGVSFSENYVDPGLNFSIGKKVSKQLFIVFLLNFSYDSYSYALKGSDINSEIKLFTIAPYFGIKRLFRTSRNTNPYYEFGIFKRFSFASTEDYFFDAEEKTEFENAVEDVTSPIRLFAEFGVEHFFTDNFVFGLSVANYIEYISGSAINNRDNSIYDFSKFRFGQFYNLNFLLYF